MFKRICLAIILSAPLLFGQVNGNAGEEVFKRGLDFYLINGFGVAYNFGGNGSCGFRIEADLGVNLSDGKCDNNTTNTTGQITTVGESNSFKQFGMNIWLSPQVIFPLYNSERIFIRWGTGPIFKYSYSKTDNNYSQNVISNGTPYATNNSAGNRANNYYLGAGVFLSVEGRVNKILSLFLETSVRGGKAWENSTINQTNGDYSEITANRWFLSLENIRIGASIYF